MLLHLMIVALGLGALLAASETAFALVKFIGAAYLVWLGIQRWRAPPLPADATPDASPVLSKSLLLQGLMVNLTNPKAILFYVSFFVQFIDVNATTPGLAFFILALTLEVISFMYMSFLIFSGAFVTRYLKTKKKLAFYERGVMDTLRGLEGDTRTDALRNYYEHTAKMMKGSKLDLPQPIQIPSPAQAPSAQKMTVDPQHRPERSQEQEPEISR